MLSPCGFAGCSNVAVGRHVIVWESGSERVTLRCGTHLPGRSVNVTLRALLPGAVDVRSELAETCAASLLARMESGAVARRRVLGVGVLSRRWTA